MTLLSPPRMEGSIRLRDGRHLGLAEYGSRTGRPLLWFHGTPGSRRQIAPSSRKLAEEQGIRLISVERPGIGTSTPHAYHSMSDFSDDIEELCDALGVDCFGVTGLSGGGPYALACAQGMPDRVASVTVLGGVAPVVGVDAAPKCWSSSMMRRFSPVARRTHRPLGFALKNLIRLLEPAGDKVIEQFSKILPPGDQEVFADPGIKHMFLDDLTTGGKQNMQALFLDAALFGRYWGFTLSEIKTPVRLHYGDADAIVPISHGYHMAERIPNATLDVRSGEGHLGGLGATEEIFQFLDENWKT